MATDTEKINQLVVDVAKIGKDICYIKKTVESDSKRRDEICATHITRTDDHEKRIRWTEKAVWLAIGGAAIISSIVGFLIKAI